MSSNKYYVFVYGTLMKGERNHEVMRRAGGVFIGNAETIPEFDMTSYRGAFPAMMIGGSWSIRGEVYEVDSLEPLDILEGYPDFYYRTQTPITVGEVQYNCWFYYVPKLQPVSEDHISAFVRWMPVPGTDQEFLYKYKYWDRRDTCTQQDSMDAAVPTSST